MVERDLLKIDNGVVSVEVRPAKGTFVARRGKARFVTKGRLAPAETTRAKARVAAVNDVLGKGRAVELAFASGAVGTVAVYDRLPFVCFRLSPRNTGHEAQQLAVLPVLSAEIDAAGDAGNLAVLGTEGPHAANWDRDYYSYLAVAHPTSRRGVVAGWITHEAGSGVVSLRGKDAPLKVEARCEYGTKAVPPGTTVGGETLVLGFFDDCLDGLEAYADAAARANGVRLPAKVPSGYCTWYHAGSLDERRMAELAEFCKAQRLTEYGLDFLQIDDGWQISRRDFTTHNPRGRYRGGMKATADHIKSNGLIAGLWLTPFGWDHKRPAFRDRQGLFMKARDGSVLPVHWAGDCLDCTNPDARAFLRGVLERIVKEWGYEYLKIDGLWAGMGPKILYPAGHYRDDRLGRMVLHEATKSPVEAYREALRTVRRAVGRKTYLLGCNCAQNYRTLGASFGLLDAMRVGPDLTARWRSLLRAAHTASWMYFLHGRVWHNDPDCLMLRDPLTVDQARAWASMIAVSGQLSVVSEWLPGLPPEKLDVLHRTLPNSQHCGRPLDLFAQKLPRVWHLRVGEGKARRDVVALINWSDARAANLRVTLSELRLPAAGHVFFETWTRTLVGESDTAYAAKLPRSSCQVLSVVSADRPAFLASTRHVLGGIVELADPRWSEDTLSAAFRGVTGRADEIAVYMPSGLTCAGAKADGRDVPLRLDGRLARLTVKPARPGDVKVEVRFARAK